MSSDFAIQALSAGQASKDAALQEEQGKLGAEMEDVAALQQETDRKLDLARGISAARARAGASGIDVNTGSPLSVIQAGIEDAERDQRRDDFNTRIRKQSALFQGNLSASQTRMRRNIGLLKFASDKAETAATGGIK